ncbi:hypothetical protein FRC14_003635 [Serendipita sp. 396]|nr:hypothetical protein FRC14_003635 [Serendipita sp. 396]KAG8783197.1 hypothetical protein FRC15_005655 [Serendipita sp. 397]KAG8825726.1 hypothetical protein FRC19_010643 [Serendipita sp. 401]KAG8867293.1 hypothetical protein FRC20_006177 [Serendipita sp. 405]KAG9056265.1 hypothetical protein FS842_011203 [Serendipita sp. 407]
MALLTVLILSGALALSCFIVGNLPLTFSFSRSRVAYLSTLGIGLLLGAGLGVIIPEGANSIYKASTPGSDPSHIMAYCLLSGFTLMLLVEQVLLSTLGSNENEYALAPNGSTLEAARSTSNLHNRIDSNGTPASSSNHNHSFNKARSITFGLIIHSLADGLALGASTFSTLPKNSTSHGSLNHRAGANFAAQHKRHDDSIADQIGSNSLTLVVFLALIIHKVPTALALSTSLLPLIPTRRIRLHIAAFSIATPLGAVLSYLLLALFNSSTLDDGKGQTGPIGKSTSTLWAGIALTFSGGTFLYVATVLQPVGHSEGSSSSHGHGHPGDEDIYQIGRKTRVFLIVLGMALPIALSSLIGHGHD